jgi:hypothetical protein
MAIDLVSRVTKILSAPNSEWDVIAAETTTTQELLTMYAAPLIGAAQLAAVLGLLIFAQGPVEAAIKQAIIGILLNFIVVMALAAIIDGLAENFGSKKDFAQSAKVAVYSMTPLWIGSLIAIIPQLGILGLLFGLYSLYLIFIGLPKVKQPRKDQEAVYALAVIGAIIILTIVVVIVLRQLVASVQGA